MSLYVSLYREGCKKLGKPWYPILSMARFTSSVISTQRQRYFLVIRIETFG